MITVIATVRAKPGKGPEVEADFRAWAEVVAAKEPGTLQYTLHRSREDPQVYFTVELFTDQSAVDAHIRNFQARPAGPDLFDEPPKIQVFDKIV